MHSPKVLKISRNSFIIPSGSILGSGIPWRSSRYSSSYISKGSYLWSLRKKRASSICWESWLSMSPGSWRPHSNTRSVGCVLNLKRLPTKLIITLRKKKKKEHPLKDCYWSITNLRRETISLAVSADEFNAVSRRFISHSSLLGLHPVLKSCGVNPSILGLFSFSSLYAFIT